MRQMIRLHSQVLRPAGNAGTALFLCTCYHRAQNRVNSAVTARRGAKEAGPFSVCHRDNGGEAGSAARTASSTGTCPPSRNNAPAPRPAEAEGKASSTQASSTQHKQHPARPLQCPAPLHTLQQAHDLPGPWQSLCLAVSHILANAVCS